jgi:hypothetical protein
MAAKSIPVFCRDNSISRSLAYEEIAKGRLVARKLGSRTLIIDTDERNWLQSLPRVPAALAPSDAAAEDSEARA